MKPHQPVEAVRRLERVLELQPLDLGVHHQLAQAHQLLLQQPDHEAELTAICQELPFAFTSELHLAAVRDARGARRAAVAGYLRAIRIAQLRGFWFDHNSTPPWLLDRVLRAMDVAHRGRAELFHELLEPLIARHGNDELARVRRALAMYVGLEPLVRDDPRQQPSFFYVPDLPRAPVFPRDALPFAAWYEAQAAAIAEEMHTVRDGDGVQPFHYDVAEAERGQLTRGAWDAYFFFEDGVRNAPHHAACPRTSAVLDALPLDHVRDHGPEVCFSIMRPGAHILPHRGVTNTRAVLHLGLDIPPGCALNLVGVEALAWEPGRCFAFDDTYEHEAWNRSDRTRAVLLGDIWNPFLRPAECEALATLIAAIGDFNREVTR